jgi:3-oxoacyl-[acyl-carrier protein] reductase
MSAHSRTALITGSGRNIGRGIAIRLAEHGFNVVVNGAGNRAICDETAALVRERGTKAFVVMADIGVEEDAKRLAAEGIEKFGAIDVLVNNAAIRPSGGFLDTDDAQWQRVMDVNLNSVRWLAQACLPGMVAAGWGRIVNFTGMNAQKGYPGKSHVTVSKHGVWGLTKSLALEFGPAGITTNIISPGTIVGESADTHSAAGQLGELLTKSPVGRLGTPADIASMVAMLVEQDGGFVNGQLLQINGGVTT